MRPRLHRVEVGSSLHVQLKHRHWRMMLVTLEPTPSSDPGTPVRKLIGHSGPVYSLAFDPIAGSAYAPSHLLSSSQDGTVRLWSTDTYKNLAVYKGHADPVWAVEWGPYGAQFATASRDRTARLWITDRVAPVRMFAGHLSDVDVGIASFLVWTERAEC
jgi:transcription initiation factor TFIID subunit 5